MSEQSVLWPKEGRRQPVLVGRDAAGKPLLGGPYTIYQLAAVLIVGITGFSLKDWWGAGMSIIPQTIYVLAASVLAGLLAGRIDFLQNNPFWSATGWVKGTIAAFTHPHGSVVLPAGRSAWKPEKPVTTSPVRLQILPLPDLGSDDLIDVEHPSASEDAEAPAETTLVLDDSDQEIPGCRGRRGLHLPVPGKGRRMSWHRSSQKPEPCDPESRGSADEPSTTIPAVIDSPTVDRFPSTDRQSALETFLAAAERSHP